MIDSDSSEMDYFDVSNVSSEDATKNTMTIKNSLEKYRKSIMQPIEEEEKDFEAILDSRSTRKTMRSMRELDESSSSDDLTQ